MFPTLCHSLLHDVSDGLGHSDPSVNLKTAALTGVTLVRGGAVGELHPALATL